MEASVTRNHIEWVLSMPWGVYTKDNLDITHAKEVLEQDSHFSKVPTWYSNVDTTYGNPEANNLPFKQFIRSAIDGLNEYLEVFDID